MGLVTTFSIANDVSKYFAIIPAAFASTYPILGKLNFMHLSTPESAILSAVIFNALIIIALIPLALKGVPYRPKPAAQLLRDNLLIYGLGGLIAPFIGIKVIDMLLTLFTKDIGDTMKSKRTLGNGLDTLYRWSDLLSWPYTQHCSIFHNLLRPWIFLGSIVWIVAFSSGVFNS